MPEAVPVTLVVVRPGATHCSKFEFASPRKAKVMPHSYPISWRAHPPSTRVRQRPEQQCCWLPAVTQIAPRLRSSPKIRGGTTISRYTELKISGAVTNLSPACCSSRSGLGARASTFACTSPTSATRYSAKVVTAPTSRQAHDNLSSRTQPALKAFGASMHVASAHSDVDEGKQAL